MSFSDFVPILPEIMLVAWAGLVMTLDIVWPARRKRGLGWLTAAGFGLAGVALLLWARPAADNALIFGGMLRDDLAAYVFRLLFVFAGLAVALFSLDAPGVSGKGDYYALLLVAVLGMNLMAAATDLIMLYLALETASITLYLLAGYLREQDKSAESGLKYFLFGAFTSAIMLYGLSLLYGFTGQTGLYAVSQALGGRADAAVIVTILLILTGFGFKVSMVPFHFWTPDVYEGAPTPVWFFLSVASKAAGFAVLVRVLLTVFPALAGLWLPLIGALAAVTMFVGNLVALTQKNIKRLLAYSSIAQAGYALIGLAAAGAGGAPEKGAEAVAALIFYLIMYTLTNLAAFGVVIVVGRITGSDEIKDYAGLSRRSPGLALALLVALLSLAGMPPLAGFFAKFYVFLTAVQAPEYGLVWLAGVGVLNAIIGLYYYLTVLKVVYLYRSEQEEVKIPVPRAYALALWACIIGILALGVWAAPGVDVALAAAQTLIP